MANAKPIEWLVYLIRHEWRLECESRVTLIGSFLCAKNGHYLSSVTIMRKMYSKRILN